MKSEKEKMLAGELYLASDVTLTSERLRAKVMLFGFNTLPPAENEKRMDIIRQLFGSAGSNIFIEPPFRCDYGYNIFTGNNFYANYDCIILDCAAVNIGDNVLFGPRVNIYTASHPVHHEKRIEGYEFALPVNIGNNVWIGGNSVINPGVTIGDNCVIGSGSVVTHDIPAGVLAAGNPCRGIRRITDFDK